MKKNRLIVGMSGASGAPLTLELLRQFKNLKDRIEIHLVYTRGALETLKMETDISVEELCSLADICYENEDIGAAIASGSFRTMGMIIVPCSMKTLAGIVSGYSDNLLLRAADVTLKERRPLVIVPRETPLSTIHLRNMYEASKLGITVLPPMVTYYARPKSIVDMNRQIAGKILDQFGLDAEGYRRWGEE